MNAHEKQSRLIDIDRQIETQKPTVPLLNEALDLALDLGFDGAWQRYKALKERRRCPVMDKTELFMLMQLYPSPLDYYTLCQLQLRFVCVSENGDGFVYWTTL